MPNKFVTRHGLCAIALIALLSPSLIQPASGFSLSDSDLGRGVLGFLRSLESTIEKRTTWFYRHFGQNVDPVKIDRVRLCSYGDRSTSKYCSPAPFVKSSPSQNPNLPDGVTVKNNPLSKVDRSSFTSIPMICLQDPDATGCRDLRTLIDRNLNETISDSTDPSLPGLDHNNTWSTLGEDDELEPTPAPDGDEGDPYVSEPPSVPSGAIVSESPTKYMCFGNHEVYDEAAEQGVEGEHVSGKWCESSMPSVSLEPSGAPSGFVVGDNNGDSGTFEPTAGPSRSPSEEPSVGPSEPPSEEPSEEPSVGPSESPSEEPSASPSGSPSEEPVQFGVPGLLFAGEAVSSPPSESPTNKPTYSPVFIPQIVRPTKKPTNARTSFMVPATPVPKATPKATTTFVPPMFPNPGPGPGPNIPNPFIPNPNTPSPTKATTTFVPPNFPNPGPGPGPNIPNPFIPNPTTPNPTMGPNQAPNPLPTRAPFPQFGPPGPTPQIDPPGPPTPIMIFTPQPTDQPTSGSPSDGPSSSPSDAPSSSPSDGPSAYPSDAPSGGPSSSPSASPSGGPSSSPSVSPSDSPSASPSDAPSGNPSESPSDAPSSSPSESPSGSFYPSSEPSDGPTVSAAPSASPSGSPSLSPSDIPSSSPSYICEREFIRFDVDGFGDRTDKPVCDGDDMTNPLPHFVSLGNDIEIGTLKIDYHCSSFYSSELIVTLELNEDYSVTGDSSVTIMYHKNKTLEFFQDDGMNAFEEIAVFSDYDVLTASIPMDAMPSAGPVWFNFSTEVNAEFVSFNISSICYECGAENLYFASPTGFLEDGFEVHAYGDESTHTENNNLARYMHTGLHEFYEGFDTTFVSDEVGTCLIIQESNTALPISNPGGGNITFNFTESDDFFEFELFNVQNGATVFVFASDGTVTSIPVESVVNGIQNIVVTEPATEKVTIQFEGPGAVCGIKSCVTGVRPPSSGYNNQPSHTLSPTVSPAPSSSPSDAPSRTFYPSSQPSDSPTSSVQPSASPSSGPTPSPSSIPSSAPTDCLYRYRLTEEDILNQMGPDEPMPEDAVMKINGEHHNISIAVTQLWSKDANISFFIQYHSDTHDTVCEGIPDFEYEDTLLKDMECYDGWTDIALFIYYGDEVTIDECEECKPPDTDEEGILAYYFELDCEPICEPLLTEAPTSPPTDCYDRQRNEERQVGQGGAEYPLPQNTIKIIKGEDTNVTVEISHLWSDYANISFYMHYHSETHESVCEGVPEFSYEDTIVMDLECYEGFTDLAFFVYTNPELSLDECEECKGPEEGDDSVIAYYFELPCEPICEDLAPTGAPDPSPPIPPTDCYDQYGILESDIMEKSGVDVHLPENAIRIINGEDTGVTLEISQYWSDDANISFFIQYENGKETVCEGTHDFVHDDTLVKDLVCQEGWAAFTVVAYLDDELSPEDCNGCKAPEVGVDDIVAYSFEIPCKPICESAAPSEVPVTVSPSVAPTDCYEKHGITEEDFIDKFGTKEPIPQNAIMKINGEHHNVSVSFTQLWSEDVSLSAFFHYHAVGHGSVCEGIPEFKYNDTIVKTMECYEGFTDVGVFFYSDDGMTFEECEECRPPDIDDENTVAYYFEIDCEPICEDFAPSESPAPEEPDCYDGTIAVTSDTGDGAMCKFETAPFFVETKSTSEIELSFTNNWSDAMDIQLYYDKGAGAKEYHSLGKLQPSVKHSSTLTAACQSPTEDSTTQIPTAEIELVITNVDGSCSFVFQISCSTETICGDTGDNRKLEDGVVANAKIDEYEDTPYCAHKDYPCNGDEENMVYVCHYSSRAGYQTFCMPEMDSDVIRFNKNHHCGTCDGWNGVERNGQVD